ncbi:MAG: glycosyltransferase, partial [bacterium]|nr:glycosyltransferase [bacterium]
ESSSKLNWLKKPILHYLRLWDSAAAGRVDYFIANSRNTAWRIKKYYNRDSVVIYPPVDSDYPEPSVKEKSEVPFSDYYLIVSRLLSYKRVDLAVDVFNRLNLPLVIIGDGLERRRLERRAKKNIKFLGWQNGKIKNLYLKHCSAFIFPGEEDFGIAPVEAMNFGKPVLAFRAGGLLETVIEGKTGEFFDRQSSDSLSEGFERLQSKNYDQEFIKNHAQKFGKERFIREIKTFIEKVYTENSN